MKKLLFLFLFILLSLIQPFAQGYLHRSGTTIVDGNNKEYILHGVGIGGWLVQEGYMFGNSGNYYTQYLCFLRSARPSKEASVEPYSRLQAFHSTNVEENN